MPISKVCVVCGTGFSVKACRAESAKTCSDKCRGKLQAQRYKEARPVKVCENCGVEYGVKPHLRQKSRFCSVACKKAHNTVTFDCLECGKPFSDYVSRLARNPKYCSKSCHAKAQRGGQDRVELACGQCGQRYTRNPSAASNSKYCSMRCLWEAKKTTVEVVCENCAKPFEVNGFRAESAKFCSESCKWQKYTGDPDWSSPEGLNREGYKRHNNSYEHRRVMLDWMLEVSPDHPFVVREGDNFRLSESVDVHHVDRDRTNNSRENLLAVLKDAHARMHHKRERPKPWECWPPNPTKF